MQWVKLLYLEGTVKIQQYGMLSYNNANLLPHFYINP